MNVGIAGRMAVAGGVLVLLVAAAFTVLLISVQNLRDSEQLAQRSDEVLAAANELERLVVDLETGQRGFVITGEQRFLQPWEAARAALPEAARALERLTVVPEQNDRSRQIIGEAMAYLCDYSVPLINAARRDPASARTVAATAEGKRRVDAMRADFDELVSAERRLSQERQDNADAVARRAVIAAAVGLVGSVVLLLGFAGYLTRAILRPVLETASMAGRLAGGDLAVRVPETGVGEIRTLEQSFNSMARSLQQARAELAASRARVVASADEARRKIERDLHDGIQQRLVSLALDLRAVESMVPTGDDDLQIQLDRIAARLSEALDELREISRGIHPAILSEGGLGPALKALARRSTVPVEVDVKVESRLPPPVEIAAYYVVSEALTNTAKHANASVVEVNVQQRDGRLHLSVRDDGRGGADTAQGTGLVGLADRVQALDGKITIHSIPSEGTTLQVDLPIATT